MPLRHTSSSSAAALPTYKEGTTVLPWLSCACEEKTHYTLLVAAWPKAPFNNYGKGKKCRNCKKFRQFIAAKICPGGGTSAECRFGAAHPPPIPAQKCIPFPPPKYACLIFKPLTRSPTTTRNPTLRKIRAPTFPTKFTKCYGKRDFLCVCGTHRRR